MYGRAEPRWVHKFRIYGLPLCYLLYISIFWTFYERNIITSDPNQHFSFGQTCWIWSLRLSTWLVLPAVFYFLLTLLLYTAPSPDNDDENIGESEKTNVKSLIFRIVTIGNYKKMIEHSIIYHSSLIKEYFRCDHFSIHLITEKPLNLQYLHPQLKEILVPVEYKTKSGSMGKVRNLAYWLETKQLGNLSETETWIIDIDEDVILTNSFMKSISNRFFKTVDEPKIGLPQVLINFKGKTDWINKYVQIIRFTIDLVQHWPAMELLGKLPALCHGGCYVARADCSMDKNAECGPYCSISDDNAYILAMRSKGIKLEYIDGWFYEDAPRSILASISQRSRWQRGHAYLALYAPVPLVHKIGMIFWICMAEVIMPAMLFLHSILIVAAGSGLYSDLFPAGLARPYIGDMLTATVLATNIFMAFYGCWYLLHWKEALFYSIFALTAIPNVILHGIDLLVSLLALVGLVKEVWRGEVAWNATEKDECEKE